MGKIKGQPKTGGRTKGTKNKTTEQGINTSSILSIIKFYETVVGNFKSNKYYVYTHSVSGDVFYVGKGQGHRAWVGNRNDDWDSFVKLHGGKYDVNIVAADLTEEEALAVETALIRVKNPICNIVNSISGQRPLFC